MKIYSGKRISVELSQEKKEIIRTKPAIAILPIDSKGEFILIKQFRFPLEKKITEIPAGLLDPNEDPEEGAQRELREETGFMAEKMTYLGSIYTSPGCLDENIHLFLAENLKKNPLPPDKDEDIELFFLSPKEALAMIETNQIKDAKTIISILRYLKERL